MPERSNWFLSTKLGDCCNFETHCSECGVDGDCDPCMTIDGRWIEAVCEYASTCDGPCMELTHHDYLTMDLETQLGYCEQCIPGLPDEIRARLQT